MIYTYNLYRYYLYTFDMHIRISSKNIAMCIDFTLPIHMYK
jgi:hypothetical protein